MPLTQQQIDQLLKPLHPSRVMQKKGQAYLAAWDVRRWLLRIFGPGGWTFEVRQCEMAHQIEHRPEKAGEKVRWTVVYRAVGRLTIKDPDGFVVGFWEDGATGDGARQPSLGDAHDLAMKTAISQALKRCAVNLGDQFGLGLYNNGRLDPVVARYLSGSPELPSVPVEDAPVESDEYDPTRETPVAAEEERPAGRAQQAPASQWEQPPAPDPRVGALLEKVRTAWTDAAELAALLKEAGDAGLVNAWVPTNSGPAPLGQMLTARLTDLAARAGEAPDLRAQLVEAARRAGFDEEQIREEFERNYGTAYGEASDDQLIDMRKLMEKAA